MMVAEVPISRPFPPRPGDLCRRAVHAYLADLSYAAIEAMLNELATELGAALGKSAFMSPGRTWIFDAGEHRG